MSPPDLLHSARFWDRVARKYARSAIADPAGYERTIERVNGLLSPRHQVLELGCGTGTTAMRLAHGCATYLATDISQEMIQIAREKLAQAPSTNLQFEVVEATAALAEAARYDVVMAFNLLHLVDDLDALIRAIHRGLRPGGMLISKTPCLAELNPVLTRFVVPLMQRLGRAPAVQIFNADRVTAALNRNGFCIDCEERHGIRGKDFRTFIVAKKVEPSRSSLRTSSGLQCSALVGSTGMPFGAIESD